MSQLQDNVKEIKRQKDLYRRQRPFENASAKLCNQDEQRAGTRSSDKDKPDKPYRRNGSTRRRGLRPSEVVRRNRATVIERVEG